MHKTYIYLASLEKTLFRNIEKFDCKLTNETADNIAAITHSGFTHPQHVYQYPAFTLSLLVKTFKVYFTARNDLRNAIQGIGILGSWDRSKTVSNFKIIDKLLRIYLLRFFDLAVSNLWQSLLVYWRVFHISLLYILVITSLIHVLAVHMY